MRFVKMTPPKTKIVLVQLGSPKSPKVAHVREFLREFLGDPRVVDINPLLWKFILYFFVLPFRPKRSAEAYGRIWEGDSFPLVRMTHEFAVALRQHLNSNRFEVNEAFLLSHPRIGEVFDEWEQDLKVSPHPATDILVVPLFPQYSESTIASGIDGLAKELAQRVNIPNFKILTHFHRSKAFIDSSLHNIHQFLKTHPVDDLIISFHGIPKRRVITKNDFYYQHCFETFKLLQKNIQTLDQDHIHMTFQSRFGSEEWLTPYTDQYALELAERGSKRMAFYCPSFVTDCLETIDEIGYELAEELKQKNVDVKLIPCLNTDPHWCQSFAQYLSAQCEGGVRDLEYELEEKDYLAMETPVMQSEPLSEKAKNSLKIVFLTLFLDLVGFSIIFPLFPQLAKYYLEVDSQNYFLRLIFDSVATLMAWSGEGDIHRKIVLFGGALGALYSFLQFLAAPFWGSLSDRIGRKPVLLVSVSFLALSYLLWFFSGSFTLLIAARFIGGVMGGNISTATAVVADVTSEKNRSKGMATIGIAFALGFIIGPAMGGILSMIDLSAIYPKLKSWGVNPFSMPALVAFVLSLFNIYYLARKFEETLPERKDEKETQRTSNIFKLFQPLPFPGVNGTNIGHFLFLTAFSGMEFTLTFLAVERLGYTSLQNGYMFIFIGFIIAFVQGGVVRRRASQVGEKKMALIGLMSLIPGLLLIAWANSSFLLYGGLFFLACGSAMAIPCLTSLVSLYSPADMQGRSIGIFRSLGALARVIGPILAAVLYWRAGSSTPYLLGSLFLVLPILMVSKLPWPPQKN